MTTVEEILKNIGEEMADNEWIIDNPYILGGRTEKGIGVDKWDDVWSGM